MDSSTEYRTRSKWVELFHQYPILEAISSYLTIADVLVLYQVCKGLDELKDRALSKISNINVWLTDFVGDPVMFRSQLGSNGGLISGPFALNVFELGHRKVSCLDVFIRDGTNVDNFTRYIREHEKYRDDNPDETVRKQYLGSPRVRSPC
ncbi:hypothetical protein MMYC01_204670 [Madurella mycetomatis]|uniref:Uncharacterized protein n=1 Tax=Madurella mycetomatis TaxID=100816 RepID=A0A175WBJ1_9PEZI|nr:hypothetical protein MMYC01_204670 [Madurella mycetomatis]